MLRINTAEELLAQFEPFVLEWYLVSSLNW